MVRSIFWRKVFDIAFSHWAAVFVFCFLMYGAYHFLKIEFVIAAIIYIYVSYFWLSSPESAYQIKVSHEKEEN